MQEKYDITGMSCAACSTRVEKAVSSLPGMEQCSVNLLKNSMVVNYDDHTLTSSQIVEALLIPVGTLSKITKKNVYAENFVYKEAAKRFSDVVEALQQIMFLSLTQRVAAFLLDESAKNHSQLISVTHEELARQIGSAREAVSRILKQMAKKGYITLTRGEVKLENKEEMYKLLN